MKLIGSLTVKAIICMVGLGIAHSLNFSTNSYFVCGVVAGGIMTLIDEFTK